MTTQLALDISVLQGEAVRPESAPPVPAVLVAGRRLRPTSVFDTYWRFAAARHAIYEARLANHPPPWTTDPVLARHRFTNCFRAADRVSQNVIGQVSYQGAQAWPEVFFRTLLFKIFNRLSTWRLLQEHLGEVRWDEYDRRRYDAVLTKAFLSGQRLYSAAYVMPSPPLGELRKHSNHLLLIEQMMISDTPLKVAEARTMREAFEVLRAFPGIGDFLAFQYLIDLNYSDHLNFSEMAFVVAGPGARDGVRKCFGPAAAGMEPELIRYMADKQEEHFDRLGLTFCGLRGRRLQLIDCQNLFCEVDKYARVVHPDIVGISGRTRIKQTYRVDSSPMTAWFPPKWGINPPD